MQVIDSKYLKDVNYHKNTNTLHDLKIDPDKQNDQPINHIKHALAAYFKR